MSQHHLPLHLESLQGGARDDLRCDQQFASGDDDFAHRYEDAVLANTIPDSDISTARLLCDRNIHVKRWHAIRIEVLHCTLPTELRGETSLLSGGRQLKSPSKCHFSTAFAFELCGGKLPYYRKTVPIHTTVHIGAAS